MQTGAKYNPFRPSSPVHSGMFVGRIRESERIENSLMQTRSGNPRSFMITGERGIGKTSLLYYTRVLAEGKISIGSGTDKLNYLVIQSDIETTTTPIALIRKIELGLRKALDNSATALTYLSKTWGFLQRLEVKGIRIRDEKERDDIEMVLEECAYSLAATINQLTSERLSSELGLGKVFDGVCLLIDEADGASTNLQLGSFLKFLAERLERNDCNRLSIGLAGLPKLRDVLASSHQSSLRLFEELELGPLSREDTALVIELGLSEANKKNSTQMKIEPEAQEMLITLAEGLPHFIQQFCYSVFAKDTDWTITQTDIINSLFATGGAIEIIGNCYYRDAFYNKIQQESYRQVLRIMASKANIWDTVWVTKEELRKEFKGKTATLDNAIHALTTKNLIVRKEGTKGTYRLLHRGFAIWIKLFTIDPKQVTFESLTIPSGSQAAATSNET